MAIDVTMPQMGESVVEGTITKWLVKEGDVVIEDQPLVEISTDKVDTEIPSPGAGRIAKIVAAEGQTLPVGATLAVIEPAGAEAPANLKVVAPKAAPKPEPAPVQVKPAPPPPQPAPSPQPMQAAGAGRREAEPDEGGPRRFSPVVLKIAAEEGIDLSHVPGTGIGGRVSKRDLQRYLDSLRKGGTPSCRRAAADQRQSRRAVRVLRRLLPRPRQPPAQSGPGFKPPVYQPLEGDIVEPFTRRRKLIAEHMVYSKTHSPHVGTVAEVDVTNAMRLREKHKDEFARREGFNLTFLPLAAAATVRALKEFPRMNASVVGDSVVTRREINLGIAMDTDEGLLVPVIKAAEGMSVVGIARAIESSAPQSRREEDHRRRSRGRQLHALESRSRGQSLRLRDHQSAAGRNPADGRGQEAAGGGRSRRRRRARDPHHDVPGAVLRPSRRSTACWATASSTAPPASWKKPTSNCRRADPYRRLWFWDGTSTIGGER